jgi:hypothetical protein
VKYYRKLTGTPLINQDIGSTRLSFLTLNTKTTDGFGLKPKTTRNSFTGNITGKKRSVFHLTKEHFFLGINTFGIRMRHEFFDKVLTNKETVDYVIDHLAAANFD